MAEQLSPSHGSSSRKRRCAPKFKPTKTRRIREIALAPETVAILREHRKEQNVLKMANRNVYQDCGLVFAKRPEDLQSPKA